LKVKLINEPTLDYVDWAIGECYAKGCYTDEDKKKLRINKVANVNKHSSVLEFVDYIFEIEASTKVLLEMTRHRMASYACQSSRYTLNKVDFDFEFSGDPEVDELLEEWKWKIEEMIKKRKPNDIVSLMLPQAYRYKWVTKFNGRSLQNFLNLRTDKHAHYHIKEVADKIFDEIPDNQKFIFRGVVHV